MLTTNTEERDEDRSFSFFTWTGWGGLRCVRLVIFHACKLCTAQGPGEVVEQRDGVQGHHLQSAQGLQLQKIFITINVLNRGSGGRGKACTGTRCQR